MNDAQIRLGMAYLGAGQKDAALRAFAKVDGRSQGRDDGPLWALYARK